MQACIYSLRKAWKLVLLISLRDKIKAISYDLKQESKDVAYLDANDFYSYAISKISSNRQTQKQVCSNKSISHCSSGCVLEVDLGYRND